MAQPRVLSGASRDLTEIYLKERERSHRYAPQRDDAIDIEMRKAQMAPPLWVDTVNQIKADLASIREKDAELARLHQQRMKVDFRQRSPDEAHPLDSDIHEISQSITKLFKKCEANVKRVALIGNDGSLSAADCNIRLNVMKALSVKVNTLSRQFRERQKEFLIQLKEQSSIVDHFFPDDEKENAGMADSFDQGFTEEQLALLHEAEQSANERERQIATIAKSIHELAELFKEMSVLVSEQGSILDRVDYNVEHALQEIRSGFKDVEGGENYQKRDYAVLCIVALILFVVLMVVMVIWRGSSSSN
eukprot:TRINITY_DN2370_c0_g3_i6.p1 TRINITY_DN2370_c0_g3~~TRINITY_DN2370_c0_g3_i6.p1  ORF type:complete len:305 (-),score=95.53 TRINITY_DN2370_c0_g3_i6:208-1122(-)